MIESKQIIFTFATRNNNMVNLHELGSSLDVLLGRGEY